MAKETEKEIEDQKNKGKPGFDRRMTKDEINQLPLKRYERKVFVVNIHDDAEKAASALSKESVIGFDTEKQPTYKKGEKNPISLLQMASRKAVYLFQLQEMTLPDTLVKVLESSAILKVGVAIDNDITELQAFQPFKAGGFVDLAVAAAGSGIKNFGLRGLTAVFLGFRISKQAQQSNWAKKELTPAQIRYAAMDAWVSREIYLKMKAMRLLKKKELVPEKKTSGDTCEKPQKL